MGAAASTDNLSEAGASLGGRPDTLLAVLDSLSHDRSHMDRLHAFVQRNCDLFGTDSSEMSLACTEVHTRYLETYELVLQAVLDQAGVTPLQFGELMQSGIAHGLDEVRSASSPTPAPSPRRRLASRPGGWW